MFLNSNKKCGAGKRLNVGSPLVARGVRGRGIKDER